MDVKWKCATSGKIFPSKNKAKKFQRSMNKKDPSNIHQGLIRITVPEDKPQNISKGKLPEKKIPAKKTPKAGNRAKGTYKPSIRQDGSIFPTYEAGVIRIKESDWNTIGELLPNGARHEMVEETGHHLIFFDADAYAEIDFLMYEFNFCEQEMFYEDLKVALRNYDASMVIRAEDVCELGISTVNVVNGQCIETTPVKAGEGETLTVGELLEQIEPLTGLAIAYGKFKLPPARTATKTYGYGSRGSRGSTFTTSKKTTPTTTSKAKPVSKPITTTNKTVQTANKTLAQPKSQTTIYDEKWSMKPTMEKPQDEEESQEDDELEYDFAYDDFAWDMAFSSEEDFSRGYSSGWGSSVATVSAAPIFDKCHPIYGIKGMKLQVDRYVDLTPITQGGADEKDAETFGAEYEDVMRDVQNLSDDDYVDFCQHWGINPDDMEELSSFVMKNKDSPDVQGWITGRLMGFGVETFEAPKPKLTKNQLEDLKKMKVSTYYNNGEYAYVEVDNRGWKPYRTRTVQALLDKGIISIRRGESDSRLGFLGRIRDKEAYIVHLNPVAWEYPFTYREPYMPNLKQEGNKIIRGAETFEASEGGYKLNVATVPVEEAYAWSKGQFDKAGLNMKDYIPHFRENYQSLQDECASAIDVPRIEMPVIDPEQLKQFATSMMAGHLDVYAPFAEGRTEPYSPNDLYEDTEKALKFLYLGLQDGILQDDVVEATMTRTTVGLMRPTQSQIWLEKLIDNIIKFGTPQEDGSGAYGRDAIILGKTIAISQEGFILDGHHRYAQIVLVNPALKMQTLYIALPIRRLLEISRPYGNAIGNDQRG
mgnify:CR=1 FL=1|jgi:hypothetical protein|tara:strand:- start:8113 stop:10566 length:2454 start_codon:yes stop_codon:yes gene_type:complete